MKKITLFAALLVSTAGFAQNSLELKKGQKFTYTINNSQNIHMEVMGQTMDNKNTTMMVYDMEVVDANKDGYVISQKSARFKTSMEVMGQEVNFDSDKAEDRNGEMGQSFGKIVGQTSTFTVDKHGVIVSTDMDTTAADAANKQLLSMGISGGLTSKGSVFPLVVLPSQPLKTGLTWSSPTMNTPQAKYDLSYTVTGMTANDVLLDYKEASELNMTTENMGQQVDVSTKTTGTGKTIVDRKTGLLRTRTGVSDVNATIKASGMEIPATGKANTTITVESK